MQEVRKKKRFCFGVALINPALCHYECVFKYSKSTEPDWSNLIFFKLQIKLSNRLIFPSCFLICYLADCFNA